MCLAHRAMFLTTYYAELRNKWVVQKMGSFYKGQESKIFGFVVHMICVATT